MLSTVIINSMLYLLENLMRIASLILEVAHLRTEISLLSSWYNQ